MDPIDATKPKSIGLKKACGWDSCKRVWGFQPSKTMKTLNSFKVVIIIKYKKALVAQRKSAIVSNNTTHKVCLEMVIWLITRRSWDRNPPRAYNLCFFIGNTYQLERQARSLSGIAVQRN